MAKRARTGSLLLLAALFAAPAVAPAMHVRAARTAIAHAPDGATLLEVREMGPEGGGALTYRVEGKTAGVDFLVSSDFSPGGPTRPQTVPAETCRQRLAALEAELAKHRFTGVTVHPDGCRAKSRAGLVAVKP